MRETVAKAFGEKLAAARDKAGLSQEELGHLSAVHRTAVSELEHRALRVDGGRSLDAAAPRAERRQLPKGLDRPEAFGPQSRLPMDVSSRGAIDYRAAIRCVRAASGDPGISAEEIGGVEIRRPA
jgi:transcriptional regulator with XRE-family HTH domain